MSSYSQNSPSEAMRPPPLTLACIPVGRHTVVGSDMVPGLARDKTTWGRGGLKSPNPQSPSLQNPRHRARAGIIENTDVSNTGTMLILLIQLWPTAEETWKLLADEGRRRRGEREGDRWRGKVVVEGLRRGNGGEVRRGEGSETGISGSKALLA
ncbi:hypothetical protein JOQ06_011420 [Pogonophryne albipinna]|uniref:Uncharacterized protein n=1 Tax=Pogonophryne albipinna TaxID=1090488 RepID=A0AAD6FPV4_9TELE|nr:hypothetical protein JOQ06_011420 [Pogonophryne albipinna]